MAENLLPDTPAPQRYPQPPGLIGKIRGKLTIPGVVAVVFTVAIVLLYARLLGPVSSRDGSFSVRAPANWSTEDWRLPTGEYPLVAMHSPILKSPWGHFAVIEYLGGYAPVSDLESVWPTMVSFHAAGLSGEPGPYSTITVDGSPGIIAEGELSGGPIEFLVVDHANHTYVVMFTGSVDGFAQMLSRGFDPILASWHWN